MFLLVIVFILVPIAELYVIIQVGDAIGLIPTLVLLLADGFLGAALARSQGRAAWRRFNEALAARRPPAKEVFDGAAIIFGGALLLTPGFITDIIGISLLLPPTRALLRRTVVSGARRVGPARPLFFIYDRRAGSARGPGGPGAPGGTGPSPAPPGPARGRAYDVEGSAREIPEDPEELGPGRDG